MKEQPTTTLLAAIHESIRESIRKSRETRREADEAIKFANSHYI